ncbi:MAG TPA: SsrA-binding protein SmpB [Candidatus Udaeobacter sp.]|nr:SsrA-binding protein SmpB [Candidatus Udaeobacter sp.]
MPRQPETAAAPRIELITSNRKASHEFHLLERFEAGVVLQGTEVKSLRHQGASLQDAYGAIEGEEIFLYNCHIAPYEQGNRFNHETRRKRRLLMHKREILKLKGRTLEKGLTLIPTRLYFKNGRVKLELALARGKKIYDKRADVAKRDADREVARAVSRGRRGGEE